MVSEKSILLLEQSCNSELHRLKKWCVANKLQINPDKSVLIYIPFKLNDFLPKLNIAYDDVLVPSNNSSKYLGIKIDSKLNFQPHLNDDVQNYPVFSPSTEVAGFTPFDCISIPPVSISLDPRHLPFLTPTSSLLLQLFSSMCFLADLFFFYP